MPGSVENGVQCKEKSPKHGIKILHPSPMYVSYPMDSRIHQPAMEPMWDNDGFKVSNGSNIVINMYLYIQNANHLENANLCFMDCSSMKAFGYPKTKKKGILYSDMQGCLIISFITWTKIGFLLQESTILQGLPNFEKRPHPWED